MESLIVPSSRQIHLLPHLPLPTLRPPHILLLLFPCVVTELSSAVPTRNRLMTVILMMMMTLPLHSRKSRLLFNILIIDVISLSLVPIWMLISVFARKSYSIVFLSVQVCNSFTPIIFYPLSQTQFSYDAVPDSFSRIFTRISG